MTLTMTVVTPWAIWQSSDHRLLRCQEIPKSNRLINTWTQDSAVKTVRIDCFGGEKALLTYTGWGMWENVHVSDWVADVLRGHSRNLVEILRTLTEEATAWLGKPSKENAVCHVFAIGYFDNRHAGIAVIRNDARDPSSGPVSDQFYLQAQAVVEDPLIFLAGAYQSVAASDIQLLKRVVSIRKKRANDFMKLLAAVTARAHEHPKLGALVSPECVASYLPVIYTEQDQPSTVFFDADGRQNMGQAADLEHLILPTHVAGIDIGRMMKHVAKTTDGIYATEGWDSYLQHWFDAMKEADNLAIEPATTRNKPSN